MWYRKITASPIDEGMTDFGYKDIIKTDDNVTEKEIADNIKDFYIGRITKEFLKEEPNNDPEYLADYIQEVNEMWEEHLQHTKQGDKDSMSLLLNVVAHYNSLLPDGSKEKEMLSSLLDSGQIVIALTRNE